MVQNRGYVFFSHVEVGNLFNLVRHAFVIWVRLNLHVLAHAGEGPCETEVSDLEYTLTLMDENILKMYFSSC